MALVVKDRVKEVTSTTGTGTLTLSGAVTKFQSFGVIGDGNTTYYAIESGNGTDWEIGVGTYTASGTTLSRDTILESSNAGSAINLSGTSTVFCTYPAERSVNTADIGTTIQAYDADTAKYDDTTANFTGTLQNGGSNVVVDTDIGVTVQAYDADTTKNDVANTFTANQTINGDLTVDTNTLYVDSTNNRVGIGTSSPLAILDVASSTTACRIRNTTNSSAYILFQNSDSGTTNTDGLYVGLGVAEQGYMWNYENNVLLFGTANTERMRISNNGYVGIGTSTPNRPLEVYSSSLQAPVRVESGQGTCFIDFKNSDTTADFQVGFGSIGDAAFCRSGGSERIRIATNGNVGIGTTSPTGLLTLNAAIPTIDLLSSGTGKASILTGSGGRLVFYTGGVLSGSGAERMCIDSSGNVGIGVANPSAPLSVTYSNNTANPQLDVDVGITVTNLGTSGVSSLKLSDVNGSLVWGDGSASAGYLTFRDRNASAERMRIDSSGNVGIGTSSPNGTLHLNSATNARINITGGSAAFVRTLDTGGVTDEKQWDLINDGGDVIWRFVNDADNATADIYNVVRSGNTVAHHAWYAGTNTEAMRITSTGNVGIGTSSPSQKVEISYNVNASTWLKVTNTDAGAGAASGILFANDAGSGGAISLLSGVADGSLFLRSLSTNALKLGTNNTERMRIDASGNVLVGTTSAFSASSSTAKGLSIASASNEGQLVISTDNIIPVYIGRQTSDGIIISLRQAGVGEGSISVSGTTVSYNGGHLSRFTQLPNSTKDESILKGTVLSNLDEMCVYVNKNTGETVDNEQLNKVKVSDVEGDTNVAGVLVSWIYDEQHDVEEINMGMTGDMIIRIAQGVTVNRGDLLMSAGDGTAKPQGDDIVRSKTIAKVTSANVTCTYDDGSYCVPCVLMAC